MGETTGILWTDSTFNGWWGCTRVSPGCEHCYAETLSHRLGFNIWGQTNGRRITSDKNWNDPIRWNRKARETGIRHRVFAFSMSDWCEQHPDLVEPRKRFLHLVEQTEMLDWQLLTKRPEHVLTSIPPSWLTAWPSNAWIMTSVENQEQAQLRIPWLVDIMMRCPGVPVVGLSVEPLLGQVTLDYLPALATARVVQLLRGTHDAAQALELAEEYGKVFANLHWKSPHYGWQTGIPYLAPIRDGWIDWVIGGGESGPKYRPCDPEWARLLTSDCIQNRVAFFWKQWGGLNPKANGKLIDGLEYCEFPTPRSRVAA